MKPTTFSAIGAGATGDSITLHPDLYGVTAADSLFKPCSANTD